MSKKPTKRGNPLTKRSCDNFTVLMICLASCLAGILLAMTHPSGAAVPAPVVDIGEPATLERDIADDFFDNDDRGINWRQPENTIPKMVIEPVDNSYTPAPQHSTQTQDERRETVYGCTTGTVLIAKNGFVSCEVAS